MPKFDHFQQQLGLLDAETLMLDSPYDYQNNTRLYLPSLGVEPSDRNYTQKVIDSVLPIYWKRIKGERFYCLPVTEH